MDLSGRCHETDLTRWLRSPVSVRSPTGNRAIRSDGIQCLVRPVSQRKEENFFIKRNVPYTVIIEGFRVQSTYLRGECQRRKRTLVLSFY